MTNKKKRGAPKHIQNPVSTPVQPDLKIIKILDTIDDPRGISCNFKHPLITILFIAFVCMLCGSDDWRAVVIQANSMINWFGKYVDISNGIPSIDTFKRVFELLSTEQFEKMLIEAASQIIHKNKLPNTTEKKRVSFDGKTVRGTVNSAKGQKAFHLLNAWSHENGICIGQAKVDDKTNEITALPELMDLLDLKDTIITADALNTQKKTVSKAISSGADYILPVKGNHPKLFKEIKSAFETIDTKNSINENKNEDNNIIKNEDGLSIYETFEKSRGRVERRKYYSIAAEDFITVSGWKSIESLVMVIRERTVKGKTSKETEYYISSCDADSKLGERVIRGHWGIENTLHNILDVTFREDKLNYRNRTGAHNLATLRKIVHGVVTKDKTLKCGAKTKRLNAATNESYREGLLKNFF